MRPRETATPYRSPGCRTTWQNPRAMAPTQNKPFVFPGKADRLALLGSEPLVVETPASLLDQETTPAAHFFVRNNGRIPPEVAAPDDWTFTVDGEVKVPLT